MKKFLVPLCLSATGLLAAAPPPDVGERTARTSTSTVAGKVLLSPAENATGNNVELGGAMIWSDSWTDTSEYPYGFYVFSDTDLNPDLRFRTGENALTGVCVNGAYYLVTRTLTPDQSAVSEILWTKYNVETGEVITEINIDSPSYSKLPLILTHDDTDGKTYALTYSSDNSSHVLATVDLSTGALHTVGALGKISELPSFLTLSAANDKIYGVATDGNLYAIDKSDLSVTQTCSTGLNPMYIQGAVYDSDEDCIWWAASLSDNTARLCRIDLPGGNVTTVGNFPNNEEFVGLYIKERIANPDAPSRITDLTFTPSAPGSLSGTLSMTLPSVSEAGTPLSGNVTVNITVDGTSSGSVSGAAGTTQETVLDLTEGLRTITATPISGSNTGRTSALSIWVGTDAPAEVTNLHLGIFNKTDAELTWDASAGGAHGGYCPSENIRYKIIRNDGTICEEAFTGTIFTETLPEKIGNYSYTVIPYLLNGPEGPASVSNTAKGGLYHEVPVSLDFNSETEFANDFVIVDNNKDNCTWGFTLTWDENVAQAAYSSSWQGSADDYIFLPGIRFDDNSMYEIEFDHTSGWNGLTENIEIVAATSAEVASVTTVLADWKSITADGTTTKKATFRGLASGVSYLAFHIYSPSGQSSFGIDNVKISRLGNLKAPEAPALSLSTSTQDGQETVTVSVTAPETDLSGSDLDEISSISIFRADSKNAVHVFTGVTKGETLEWTDTQPGNGPVSYSVIATNSHGDSPLATDEIFVGGLIPPYTASFATDPETEYFTVINANEDDSTWKFQNNSAMYEYNLMNPADDWLFSPKMRLDPERVYKISTRVRTNEYVGKPESLDITYGTSPEINTQQALIEMPELIAPYGKDCIAWLTVPTDGCYHFGFHAYSQKALLQIYIDALTVTDAASIHSPAAPTDLTVTADKEGQLKATVSFKIPGTTYDGNPVGDIQLVEILRGDEVVASFDNPTETEITWTDNSAPHGMVFYSARAANSYGAGVEASASVYVGHDTPAGVTNLRLTSTDGNANAKITWDAPVTGMNGGYVDPASLRYKITRTVDYSPTVIAEGVTDRELLDEISRTDLQTAVTYEVLASTDMGAGIAVADTIVLGALKDIPFEENFTSYLSTEWLNYVTTNYNGAWMVVNEQDGVKSVDEGSDLLMYQKWNEDGELSAGYAITPKVSLAGAANPTASLWFYHIPQADSRQHTRVGYRLNDGELTELTDIHVNDGEEGWTKYSWPVPANDGFVALELYSETYDCATKIFIDNITFEDVLQHNLSIAGFSGDVKVGPEGGKLTVKVSNRGTTDAETYDVVLLRDGVEADTKTGSSLKSGETVSHDFTLEGPTAVECGDSHQYQVRIDYTADENEKDNLSDEISVLFIESLYPRIKNLTATAVGTGEVSLRWDRAETLWHPSVTDSFEDYAPFAIDDFGTWSLHDGDGQRTYGIRYGLTYTDWYTPKAWQVWDPMRVSLLGEDVLPRTGNLCLMSMASDGNLPDGTAVTPENDDWIISEEVAGGTLVSFWLKQPTNDYGNESAEVLISSTDRNPESFTHLSTITLDEKAVWSEHSFNLPEDAKYFAIRHNSNCFGLWLDDVSYCPMRSEEELALNGYNIYRDGELVGTSTTESYLDSGVSDGIHNYAVSARYALGEGGASETVEIEMTSGVINASDGASLPRIYASDGEIVVIAPTPCTVCISTSDGAYVATHEVDGTLRKAVAPGVYIVRAGTVTRKLIVK